MSSSDYPAIFGRNLRAARLQAGLKQTELAALAGMTQQYLSAVEVGRQNVTLRTMALLAKVIGHHLADLLVEDGVIFTDGSEPGVKPQKSEPGV